jgi:hypothetical protein
VSVRAWALRDNLPHPPQPLFAWSEEEPAMSLVDSPFFGGVIHGTRATFVCRGRNLAGEGSAMYGQKPDE